MTRQRQRRRVDAGPLVATIELPPPDFAPVDGCACSPSRPCGVHWSALTEVEQRRVAGQLGFRISRAY